jgi:predicted KAP-like P-loop ATPase
MTVDKQNKEDRFPKLLEDVPATKDPLGAHERIAKALARLINVEVGGKTISIEGVWGAGKSTVVRMLAEIVGKSSPIRVFIYDAWVHSGDPLRRAFLTSLIDTLLEIDWLPAEGSAWSRRRRRIS